MIVRSTNNRPLNIQIFSELIKNHVTNAPERLIIVIPKTGGNLSIIAPNFGARRVAKIPVGKYAHITKFTLLSMFSIKYTFKKGLAIE